MRTITITRRKSFVGCLGKMKVYIEDREHPDLTISGTPCRFLGKLKNGETATFPIPTTEALLYVIADKVSRNYCSEVLPIIEGEENIYVSGQNRFDPTQGHPFRFDGINGNVTMQHRMKTSKKGLIVFIAAIIIGLIIGFASAIIPLIEDLTSPAEPQTFSESGFSITLTNKFEESEEEGFFLCYDSRDVAVMIEKVAMADFNYPSMKAFAEAYAASDPDLYTTTKEVTKYGKLMWFEYESDVGLSTFHYGAYFFEKSGYYYIVTFGTDDGDYERYRNDIDAWASSVSFE